MWDSINTFNEIVLEAEFHEYNGTTIPILTDFYTFEMRKIKEG